MTNANDEFSHPNDKNSAENQTMWSFRGYQLPVGEFSTAMVELYRGEVQRANTWRSRLDTTTNWAFLTTVATILFSFSNPNNHYTIIILCTLLITFCLFIEARRYRYYELWSYRVRLMETDFFSAMLVPPFAPSPEWSESLAESLLQPGFSVSMWEALGRRFRRNYFLLFMVLGITWGLKIFLHPTPALSWEVFVSRASLGPISGWIMILLGLGYNGLIFIIGFVTSGLRQASGEVLPKFGDFPILGDFLQDDSGTNEHTKIKATLRPFHRRQQLLSFIITAQPERVAKHIIQEMKRGVTGLHGQGMYTHADREVLMVAVMVTEMARLKSLVQEDDPNAFVAVTQAQDIFGRGFQPLAS